VRPSLIFTIIFVAFASMATDTFQAGTKGELTPRVGTFGGHQPGLQTGHEHTAQIRLAFSTDEYDRQVGFEISRFMIWSEEHWAMGESAIESVSDRRRLVVMTDSSGSHPMAWSRGSSGSRPISLRETHRGRAPLGIRRLLDQRVAILTRASE
jgi:hypothetical protein